MKPAIEQSQALDPSEQTEQSTGRKTGPAYQQEKQQEALPTQQPQPISSVTPSVIDLSISEIALLRELEADAIRAEQKMRDVLSFKDRLLKQIVMRHGVLAGSYDLRGDRLFLMEEQHGDPTGT